MGLLDQLFGSDNALNEQDIASDMLKDSKFSLLSLASSITELQNPDVRNYYRQQLMICMDQHFRLSDIVIRKDWYHPALPPAGQWAGEVKTVAEMGNDQHRI